MNIYAIPKSTVNYGQFLLLNNINDVQNLIDKGVQVKIIPFNAVNTENLLGMYDNKYYYKIL